MIKAIFFDIDGTLLSFNTHAVPQSTVDAINEVKRKGIKVFLATGRLFKQIENLNDIEFDGFITVNGAYCITAGGEVIGKSLIPKKDLESLLSYHQKSLVQFSVAFMLQEGMYVNYINDRVKTLSGLAKTSIPSVRDLYKLLDDEVLQINLYVDKATEEKIMREALVSCEASRWHPIFADVNTKGTNKSIGVDAFLHYYNIDKSETMAFGDGGNDIAMLKHVNIGVAMGNAGDDVKAVADYVTDNVDDNGVANALRHFGVIEEQTALNAHNKKEYPPMHTAEHILNQTMVRMFGCERSKNSHIERKKSKCDYRIAETPTEETIKAIEDKVNEVIERHLPVNAGLVDRKDVPPSVDLSKLPEEASQTLRLVGVGDYDLCACIGEHVSNTSEIGRFKIISHDYSDGKIRIRFKLEERP